MTKPVTGLTVWGSNTTGTTTQLDANFAALKNAINDFGTYSNYVVDTGAANAYVVTLAANLTGTLAAGLIIQFKATNVNTGASTLAFNGAAAKNILTTSGGTLGGGAIPANGIVQVIYDGTQFLLLSASPGAITRAATQATTSGTSKDFTGIPSGTGRITVMPVGVSTNGTSNIMVQLGPSGGPEATGYLSTTSVLAGSATAQTAFTTGFGLTSNIDSNLLLRGALTLTLVDAATFTWEASGVLSSSDTARNFVCGGAKSLAAELTQVRITMVNGTDAFDAGLVGLNYER